MDKRHDDDMESDEKRVTLEDFIIPQKINAFQNAYAPCNDERAATAIFDDSRLREFFKAWICKEGDPLAIYVERLERLGYRMTVTTAGDPAILVTQNIMPSPNIGALLTAEAVDMTDE